MELKHEHVGGT